MGWNDHVDHIQMQCNECGQVDMWEFWDDVAKARYGGENKKLGEFLGHDDNKSGRCPYCGSTDGDEVDD
jgi:hypothetical protein